MIVSVVLAGGQSSRMGKDKALLPVNGVPLLTRTCQVAGTIATNIYVVTPWVDRYRSILPEGCSLVDEKLSIEATNSHGPLGGFLRALTHLDSVQCLGEWVLLLACDLPYLDEQQLQQWQNSLVKIKAAKIALLPKHPKGWEVLCGFYRRSCLPSLSDYFDRGGRSFQAWLAECAVEELPISNPQFLFNCNTPSEYARVTTSKIEQILE
jgi:molybdenum cofactor guanylyltransferase